KPSADAKRVFIDAELPDGAALLHADPQRLEQAIWNLLSNAVKFTPSDGRVRIAVAVEPGTCTLTVSDTGEGIDADVLPHIFERFRQGDASTTRAHAGLGIGLALVRHIVELHGGRVRAASAGRGQGTTFHVQLPAPVMATGPTRSVPGAAQSTSPRTIPRA
ncbi:MAG: sensor histidine kinase, partial [Vicinamibacterales bacterium]